MKWWVYGFVLFSYANIIIIVVLIRIIIVVVVALSPILMSQQPKLARVSYIIVGRFNTCVTVSYT